MRHYSKLFRRVQAWVLTVAMLVPILNSGLLLGISAEDTLSAVQSADGELYYEGAIVADNYELTAAEEELLRSGLLDGETLVIATPGESDGLVTVDINKVTTANTYTSNGYKKWVPVKATYVDTDGDVIDTVPFDENYQARTTEETGDAFSVKVTYQVSAEVDQSILLKAPGLLKQMKENFDALNKQSGNLAVIEAALPTLESFAKGISIPFGTGSVMIKLGAEAAAAVEALMAQTEANVDEKTNLSLLIDGYAAADRKCRYMLENNIYREFLTTYEYINTIKNASLLSNDIADAYIQQADASAYTKWMAMKDVIAKWVTAMEPYVDEACWELYNTSVLKAELTDDEWKELDVLVEALDEITAVGTVKNPLLVAETEIQYNMAMFNLDITVTLDAEDDDMDRSESMRKTLAATVDYDAVKKVVDDFVAATVGTWTHVDMSQFVSSGYVLPEESKIGESDIVLEINYTPQSCTVDIYVGGVRHEDSFKVNYGTTIKLPLCTNSGREYDYYIGDEGSEGEPGVHYYEGQSYTVTGNTDIKRVEVKDYTNKTLNQLVAEIYYVNDEKAQAILNSGALNVGNEVLKMYDLENTVKINTSGNTYTLVAEPQVYDFAGNRWEAEYQLIKVDGETETVVASGDFSSNSVVLPDPAGATSYDKVVVKYTRDLSKITADDLYDGINVDMSKIDVNALTKLPGILSDEAAGQVAALNRLLAYEENLGLLDKTKLGALNGVIGVANISDALKTEFSAIVGDLISKCLASNNKLTIYNLLLNYKQGGLGYYYQNSATVKGELAVLSGYLDKMLETPEKQEALKILVQDAGFPEYAEKIQNLKSGMAGINADLKLPNESINLKSSNLLNLANALTKTGTPVAADTDFAIVESFTLAAPTRTTINATLSIAGTVVPLNLPTFAKTATFTEKDMEQLMNELTKAVNQAIADRKVDGFFYDFDSAELDSKLSDLKSQLNALVTASTTADKLANISFTLSYNVRTFSVTIPAVAEYAEETKTFTILDLNANGGYYYVILPPSNQETIRYDYTIGGKTISITSTSSEQDRTYGFSVAEVESLFGADYAYKEITCTEVNTTREALINFVKELNSSVSSGAQFVLIEDGPDNDKKYTIVMKMDGSAPDAMTKAMSDMAMGFVNSGYSYIAMGGVKESNTVMTLDDNNSLVVYLQPVIDVIMNSGFKTSDLLTTIDANGTVIKPLTVAGNIVSLDGKEVKSTPLGGKMIETSLHVGMNETGKGAIPLNFYITIDNVGGEMLQLREMVEQMSGNMDMVLEDGTLTVNLNLPDLAYEAFIGAMLLTGEVDIRNIGNVTAKLAVDFMQDFLEPLFAPGMSIETAENTLNKFGYKVDLSDLDAIYQRLCDNYSTYKGKDQYKPIGGNRVYVDKVADVSSLVGSMGIPTDFMNMIKGNNGTENPNEIKITVAATLENIHRDYEAVYIDLKASGVTNKFGMTKDVVSLLKNTSGPSVVILLKDIEGNLVIPNTTVLNLNGFTVKGNLVCNGSVTIVDTSYTKEDAAVPSCGSVTGEITGKAVIMAGRYEKDVSAFLKSGYAQVDKIVRNELYKYTYVIGEDEKKNVEIEINPGALSSNFASEMKHMLVDLVVDSFFNGYSTNYMEIEGNTLFNITLEDFVGLYLGDDRMSTLAKSAASMVNSKDLAAISKMMLSDLVNFGALRDAIANGTPILQYELTEGNWKVESAYVEDGNYFTVNLGSQNKETKNLSVKIVGASGETTDEFLQILSILKDSALVNVDVVENLKKPTADNKELLLGFDMTSEVVIDFTDPQYSILFSILLANGLSDNQAVINGIRSYYRTDSFAELEKAINAVKISDAIDALEKFKRNETLDSLLAKLGLANTSAKKDVSNLYNLADTYVKVLTTVLRRLDLEISDKTFGSFYDQDVVVGTKTLNGYGFSKVDASKTVSRELFMGYSVTLDAAFSDLQFYLVLFDTVIEEEPDDDDDDDGDDNPIGVDISDVKVKDHSKIASLYLDSNNMILDAHSEGLTVREFIEFLKDSMTIPGDTITDITVGDEDTTLDCLVGTGMQLTVITEKVSDGYIFDMIVKGDGNGDGRTSISDTYMVAEYFVYGGDALNELQLNALDVDGNGHFSLRDSYLMAYKYVYWDAYKGA